MQEDMLRWLNRVFLIHIFLLSQECPVQFNEKSEFLSPHKIFGTAFWFSQNLDETFGISHKSHLTRDVFSAKSFSFVGIVSICTTHYLLSRSLSALAADWVASLGTKRKEKDLISSAPQIQSNYTNGTALLLSWNLLPIPRLFHHDAGSRDIGWPLAQGSAGVVLCQY